MLHDEKQLEIELQKFWPQYKVHNIFRVEVKNRVSRVSGNDIIFKPYLTLH